MCFQVVDDVLDVTRTEAELGKPAGNDVHEGVYTLPVIYAFAADPDGAARAARPQARHGRRSTRVVALVATPDVVDASMAVARTHATKATEALAGATELDADVCDRMRTLVTGSCTARVSRLRRAAGGPSTSARCSCGGSTRGSRQDRRRVHRLLGTTTWHRDADAARSRARTKYRKLVEASFAWAAPVSFDVHHLAVDDATRHRVRRLDDPGAAARRRRDRRVARAVGLRAPRRPDRVVARASPRARRRRSTLTAQRGLLRRDRGCRRVDLVEELQHRVVERVRRLGHEPVRGAARARRGATW